MEHMEREIKKFMVTIYKCKVSPGGTFSLGNFLFDERENYRIIRFNCGTKRDNNFFSSDRKKNGAFARHIHVYLSIGSTPPPPRDIDIVTLAGTCSPYLLKMYILYNVSMCL